MPLPFQRRPGTVPDPGVAGRGGDLQRVGPGVQQQMQQWFGGTPVTTAGPASGPFNYGPQYGLDLAPGGEASPQNAGLMADLLNKYGEATARQMFADIERGPQYGPPQAQPFPQMPAPPPPPPSQLPASFTQQRTVPSAQGGGPGSGTAFANTDPLSQNFGQHQWGTTIEPPGGGGGGGGGDTLDALIQNAQQNPWWWPGALQTAIFNQRSAGVNRNAQVNAGSRTPGQGTYPPDYVQRGSRTGGRGSREPGTNTGGQLPNTGGPFTNPSRRSPKGRP